MQDLGISHQIGQSVQLVTSLGTLEVTGALARTGAGIDLNRINHAEIGESLQEII